MHILKKMQRKKKKKICKKHFSTQFIAIHTIDSQKDIDAK
jgi:hypothetical protein